MAPASPADKRTLLRRVYFDLIGLPPSADEVNEFLRDPDPRAFEQVVDKLLDSIHFGERWARHWLDLARYAETRGHEFDPIIPNAWQYRDYVIRAFNADVPYDRFLTEQVAGDLIEPRWRAASTMANPINESLLGTGFWFLGEEVHSPVDIRKDETDRLDNRIDVLTKTFLGLTVACARCHDHKFDAISQRDYYALAGYAISSSYRQTRVDTAEQHRRIAMQLDEQRTRIRDQFAKAVVQRAAAVLGQLEHYWAAALQVLDQSGSTLASTGTGPALSAEGTRLVEQFAREKELDATLVTRWCFELQAAKSDPRHPLHGLANQTSSEPLAASDASATIPSSVDSLAGHPGLIVDFGARENSAVMQDGVSFGLRPVARGELVLSTATGGQPHVATVGGWERDLFWKNITLAPGTEVDNGVLGKWQSYGRMVRSPEFVLEHRNVWYLVKGSVRAYAAVNSHLIIVGPLHNSLLREYPQSDNDWHWVSQGLEQYRGHRLHVEFSPADDNTCTVAMVVQSDEQPPIPIPTATRWERALPAGQSTAQRIAVYQRVLHDAAMSLKPRITSESIVDHDLATANTSPSRTAQDLSSGPLITSVQDRALLADWFVTHLQLFSLTELESQQPALDKFAAELSNQVKWESTLAPSILDGNGIDELLLVRGNSGMPKEPVKRRFLEAFTDVEPPTTTPPTTTPLHGSGRLELAREMLQSPLAARVAVNRIWHHLFGRGIVPSVDNLGALGLPPSHPELLDHLATQYLRNGWSTKAMIRSLVLSKTYQMSSRPTDAESHDPDNELWHRMPIKRLQGEAIRDSLLTVSGRLGSNPVRPQRADPSH